MLNIHQFLLGAGNPSYSKVESDQRYLVQASETERGTTMIADSAKILAGTDKASAVPPFQLASRLAKGGASAGSSTNLAITTSGTTANISIDSVVVGSSGGQTYRTDAWTGTASLTTVGLNGLDTGATVANGWMAIYAIYNPTTDARGFLIKSVGNTVAPLYYGGTAAPAGYTHSCLISVLPTDGAGAFKPATQLNSKVTVRLTNVYDKAAAATVSLSDISAGVPANAVEFSGQFMASSSSIAVVSVVCAADGNRLGEQGVKGYVTANAVVAGNFTAPITTPQRTYVTTSVTAGTPVFQIWVAGYSIQ